MKKLLILIAAAVFAVGCSTKDSPDTSALAKVNNTVITKKDFMKRINRLPEWAKGRFQTEEGKKNFLEEIIKEELLYQEALKKGLNKDGEFQSKIEEFKKMTLISILLKEEIEKKVKMEPEEVKKFYDENKNEFMSGLEVRARHILVATKTEAENILKRIQKNESFSELAKQFSNDKGTAQNGGDLGFFGKGRMLPEFEEVAFSLKPGETSDPVKTQFGYHIIQVTDRKEGRLHDFEEVKSSIEKQLTTEKQRAFFESYIEKLKGKTGKIKIYDEALKTLTPDNSPE